MPDPMNLVVHSRSRPSAGTAETVPPVTTLRWNPKRKAQVVRAIAAGTMSYDEACRRYRMTLEELLGWQRALDELGERGLRVTRRIRSPFDWHNPGPEHREDRHEFSQ